MELPPTTQCSTKWVKASLVDSILEELAQASGTDSLVTTSRPARATSRSLREARVPWAPTDQTSAESTKVLTTSNLASDRSLALNLVIQDSALVHCRED